MMRVLASIALPAFLLSLLMLGIESDLFSSAPAVLACQAVGLAVLLWSRASFPKGSFRFGDKPGGSTVVRTGPYRVVRHPIYAGALLILWGSIGGHFSILNAGAGLVVSLLVTGKIFEEERLLRAALPGYREYARSTKAIIPFVL
jgi:protein-S-isoprenylcysteine O-methyltransferase Ste14